MGVKLKNMLLKLKNKPVLTLIIIMTLVILLLLGGTYAFFIIERSSSQISGSANCYDVVYTKGKDIEGQLNLGTDYTSGEYVDIVMYSDPDCSIMMGTLYLTTKTETTMNLTDQALKYAVVEGTTVVSEGTVDGTANQIIYDNFPLNTTETTYRVYIWLDASLENLNNIQIETYSGFVHADARMESTIGSLAYETLSNLNLTVSEGTPDFSKIAPEISSYKVSTAFSLSMSLNETKSQHYVTYADSYDFDTTTGKFTLVNADGSAPSVAQYSSVYSSLTNKYIVSYILTSSSSGASYTNINEIYLVTSTSYDGSTMTGSFDFSKITSANDTYSTTDSGIFETSDDLGKSYYFRGNVENNYVKFGKNSSGSDMYWRIIRINGDGSIRMIYDGTSAHVNGESSSDRQVGTSAFNIIRNDNTYVGYMYGTAGATTYAATHSNVYDSTIKVYLEGDGTADGWYKDNIIDTGYSSYVVDAIYCNDRSLNTTNENYTGVGTVTTKYAANQRLASSPAPSLKCSHTANRFTKSSSLGNGKNKYPVGLISADEVVFAGGNNDNDNIKYYLYSGSGYWTMSPCNFSAYSFGYMVVTSGRFNSNYVNYTQGVRPVISLKRDALQYGTGTISDPYRVEQNVVEEIPVYSFSTFGVENSSMTLSFRTNSAGTLSFTIDGESCAGSDNIEVLLNNVSIEYGNVCNFSDDEIRSSSLSANTDYELVFNYSDPSQVGGGVYINDITFTGVDASSISVTQNDGWTQN